MIVLSTAYFEEVEWTLSHSRSSWARRPMPSPPSSKRFGVGGIAIGAIETATGRCSGPRSAVSCIRFTSPRRPARYERSIRALAASRVPHIVFTSFGSRRRMSTENILRKHPSAPAGALAKRHDLMVSASAHALARELAAWGCPMRVRDLAEHCHASQWSAATLDEAIDQAEREGLLRRLPLGWLAGPGSAGSGAD